ncbi:hypothetical protein JQX13_16410 [Archangium violaceum]|nr:DUF5953 family protein [Archangium violaceum]QRK14263.1 hypothetical protein JQX13_16410 [Archangium violaceum]
MFKSGSARSVRSSSTLSQLAHAPINQLARQHGWIVQLTDAPLDLDNPAHLDALKRAYERFPEIGGRSVSPVPPP